MSLKSLCDVLYLYGAAVALLIYMLIVALPYTTLGFSINLICIDSIESPLFPKNLTLEERHERLAQLTKARAFQLSSMTPANTNYWMKDLSKLSPDALQPPVFRALSNFYVTQVSIGSQHFSPYLMIDSGSDDTWLQCDGCTNSFQVQGGNFKFRNSSSYHVLPSESPLCVPKMVKNEICVYSWEYFGGAATASSSGTVATDTFAFHTDSRTFQSIPNIAFGCGFDNRNIDFGDNKGPHNVIAGLFGLGSGKRSILMQLEAQTKGLYSYCLPPYTAPQQAQTWLRFGDDAKFGRDAQRRAQTIQLMPNVHGYLIKLLDISVAGKRLRLDPALFRSGFIVDSGAAQTVLVPGAYTRVKNEMVEYFQRYNWSPIRRLQGAYDLCYAKNISSTYTFPTMTFHFDGASLQLNHTSIFQQFAPGFCMIIIPNNIPGGLNFLGAFQQANQRFLFDVKSSKRSFVSENCINT